MAVKKARDLQTGDVIRLQDGKTEVKLTATSNDDLVSTAPVTRVYWLDHFGALRYNVYPQDDDVTLGGP